MQHFEANKPINDNAGVKVFRLQTDFRLCLSVWLFLSFVQICNKKMWGGRRSHIVHFVDVTKFDPAQCGCLEVYSNQILLSDTNIVLHILKDVMILQFFLLVLESHTLDHEPITVS